MAKLEDAERQRLFGWFELQIVPHKLLIAVVAESNAVAILRQMEV